MTTQTNESTYRIVRFYRADTHPDHRKVIARGLTLAQAQEHCRRDDTRAADPETGETVWFDGYDTDLMDQGVST